VTTINTVAEETAQYIADMKARIAELESDRKSLVGLVLRLLDRWWPFVHGSVFPSNTAYNLGREARDTLDNLSKNYDRGK